MGECALAAPAPSPRLGDAALLASAAAGGAGRRGVAVCFRRRGGRQGFARLVGLGPPLLPLPRKQRFNPKSFLQDERVSLLPPSPAVESSELLEAGHGLPRAEAGREVFEGTAEPLLDVQVLSLEEQKALAATPAHPDGLNAMYVTYVVSCFMERVWRFAWPVVLAVLHDSLLPVAVVSFVGQQTWHFAWPALVALLHHSLLPVAVVSFTSQLVIFAAGPYVGALMDSMPRVMSFNALSAIQTAAMVLSAGVTIHALKKGVAVASTASALVFQPWFIVLVLAGSVERLTGLATGVAFERDWVVLLAGANRPIALANANAILRRVDLICEIAGPFAFGMLLSAFKPVTCLYVAVGAMVISLPLLVALVLRTDRVSSGALNRPRHVPQRGASPGQTSSWSPEEVQGTPSPSNSVILGWKKYLAQPVLPASLAYVLLYFNAVLAPGGLMTTFLTQRGLSPSVVGAFRGLCALMGFAATFVSANLISKLGVLRSGAAALSFQASLLAMAVGVYLFNPFGHKGSLFVFLFLIVMSRLGQWAYDMVDAQIFQTAIPVSEANLIGTTEVSLASLAELVMLGVAIVANDVAHFGSLAALSTTAVMVAAWVYWSWLAKPSAEQRRLFPHDPHFDKSESALQLGLEMIVPVSHVV